MELTPKTLREVEFREKRHGYHHEDVDRFLEEVASGLEVMQDRLRQALERAQRAEAVAAEAGGSDEALRKTLVLAQRTADLAVQEAREQASRILAGAEQQAQTVIAEAEEQARRTKEDGVAETRAELSRLEGLRAQAQEDVDSLQRWLDEHKAHLQEALGDAMAAVDRAGVLWPAPSTRSLDVPPAPGPGRPAAPAAGAAALAEPAGEADSNGPPTAIWSPSEQDHDDGGAEHRAGGASAAALDARAESAPVVVDVSDGPNDQALDDFFDDSDELSDDRRFGSRLRRRR